MLICSERCCCIRYHHHKRKTDYVKTSLFVLFSLFLCVFPGFPFLFVSRCTDHTPVMTGHDGCDNFTTSRALALGATFRASLG